MISGAPEPRTTIALRIVIPVLNEGAALTERLMALQPLRQLGAQLMVVDGGSTDESWARARPWVDRLIASRPGRAVQMNAGASDDVASPAKALLFLHADTELPANAMDLIESALATKAWGRFDVRLDAPAWPFRLIETMMNIRSRLTGIATGDQAIFVRTDAFHQVGGFAAQPLMEDIDLSRKLKAVSRPACLPQRARTSARKWQKAGIWRTVALMWKLRLAYFFGAHPDELALAYGYRIAPQQAKADIAIMAKAPIAGLAKTRLIPALGASGAARLQRQFILQVLHTARQSNFGAVSLWCAPHAQHKHFRAVAAKLHVACFAQPEGDLGWRMQTAAQAHFARIDAQPLLIIGTDCAVLSPGHLQQAARSLTTHDACLIPAEDGGYVLLGLRKMIPEVFQSITWSTAQVLTQTLDRLKLAGATAAVLPALWDIDESADLQRWHALENRDREMAIQ